MAPFLVDVGSSAAQKADPAWFIQDEAGKPRVHRPSGSQKDYFVLDGSSAEAMRVATDAVAAKNSGTSISSISLQPML